MTTKTKVSNMDEPAQPAGSDQVAPAEANLTITDLAALRNLIDIVTARGAFKANELSSVGVLFDKLSAFLEVAQKQQEAQAAATIPTGE